MVKLTKKVEYALLAVQEIARRGTLVSAKDIAARFDISLALVAKVLQTLAQKNIVRSFHGVNGGYQLAMDPSQISVADVMEAIDGRQGAIVECQDHDEEQCSTHTTCTIRQPLSILQERINATFSSMTVAELAFPNVVQLGGL